MKHLGALILLLSLPIFSAFGQCEDCPVITSSMDTAQVSCDGDFLQLLLLQQEIEYDDPNGTFSNISWYSDENFENLFFGFVYYDGDGCTVTQQTLYAGLNCSLEDCVELAGTVEVTIFPPANQIPANVINDGGCCPELQIDCEDISIFKVTNTLDDNGAQPLCDEAEVSNGSIFFEVETESNCGNSGKLAEYSCLGCPSGIEPLSNWEESVCFGDLPNFQLAENQIAYTDDGGIDGWIWTYDKEGLEIFEPSSFGYEGDNCEVMNTELFVFADCKEGPLAAGSMIVNLYPDYNTDLLQITEGDCETAPSLTSNCAFYQIVGDPSNISTAPAQGMSGFNQYLIIFDDGTGFNNCWSKSESVLFNCGNEQCLSIVELLDEQVNVCQGETSTSFQPELEGMLEFLDPNESFDGFVWFADEAMTLEAEPMTFENGDPCETNSHFLFLGVNCKIEDVVTTLSAGQVEFIIYPDFDASTLTETLGTCNQNPELVSTCAKYFIEGVDTPEITNGTAGAWTFSITYQDGTDFSCFNETQTVTFNCEGSEECLTIAEALVFEQEVCSGNSPLFEDAESNIDILDPFETFEGYSWFLDDALQVPLDEEFVTLHSGTSDDPESITLYVGADCSLANEPIAAGFMDLIVYPSPETPGVEVNNEVDLSSDQAADSYQWWKDGEIIDGATELNYTATETGSYQVQVLNQYDCGAVSEPVSIIISGIQALENSLAVVYPNPSSNGHFQIQTNGAIESIVVRNAQGQIIKLSTTDLLHKSIDLSQHAAGVYWLQIQIEGQTYVSRLLRL